MSRSYLILWLIGCEVKRQREQMIICTHLQASYSLKINNFFGLTGLLIQIKIFLILPNDLGVVIYPLPQNKYFCL